MTIALIGILGSMLALVIIKVRRMSIRVACQENMRQIGQAAHKISLDNGGAYPKYVDGDGIPWWVKVFGEWEDVSHLDTDKSSPGLQLPAELPKQMEIFHCRMAAPLDASSVAALNDSISYGINFDVMDSDGKAYHRSLTSDPYSPRFPGSLTPADKNADIYYFTQIAKPSEFILLSEANTEGDDSSKWTGGRISMAAINRSPSDDPPGNAPIVGRHDGLANVLFADLHIESLPAPFSVDKTGNVTIISEHWSKNVNTNTPLWTLPDD